MKQTEADRKAEWDKSSYETGRVILLGSSITLGIASAVYAALKLNHGYASILWFLLISIGYPLIGAFAIALSEGLSKACGLSKSDWLRSTKVETALVWPIVLLVFVVLFFPTLVMNKVYKRSDPE